MHASIDIGTNTVLLLIAEKEQGKVKVLHEEQRIPRLGRGVDQAKNLSADAIDRVISALQAYQNIIDEQYPQVENLQVIATSAVRDAQNKHQFLKQAKKETGLEVQILSGVGEAKYTFKGAQSVLQSIIPDQSKMVLDIGGGSTEIALGKNREIVDYYSFDMGCVRFTERYLKSDPAKEKEILHCRKAIWKMLDVHVFKMNRIKPVSLIGVAGTVTSLVYIDLDLQNYDSEKINGYKLSLKKIQCYIKKFGYYTSQQLLDEYPEVMKGRADIFLAGLLILESVMKRYGFSSIIASTGGIRHGAIVDGAKNP